MSKSELSRGVRRGLTRSRCVAACCSVLQCVAVCCVAVCCSALQRVAVCCGVLQCFAVWYSAVGAQMSGTVVETSREVGVLLYVAVCCNMLQCILVS